MLEREKICNRYINQVGRSVTVKRRNGGEDSLSAVLQPIWKISGAYYKVIQAQVGKCLDDYYRYIGPPEYDVTELCEDDEVIYAGEKFYFIRTEPVMLRDRVLYYTGTLRKIREVDYDCVN